MPMAAPLALQGPPVPVLVSVASQTNGPAVKRGYVMSAPGQAQPEALQCPTSYLFRFIQVPDIRVELPFSTDLFPNDHILANHLLWLVALSLNKCIALFAGSVGAE